MRRRVYRMVMDSKHLRRAVNAVTDAIAQVNDDLTKVASKAVWNNPETAASYSDYNALSLAKSNLQVAVARIRLAVIDNAIGRLSKIEQRNIVRGNPAAASECARFMLELHDERLWWTEHVNFTAQYELERVARARLESNYMRPFLVVDDNTQLTNVFTVYALVRQVLRRADLRPQAIEAGRRLLNCTSDEQALAMLLSYVEVVRGNNFYGTAETVDKTIGGDGYDA